MHGVMFGKHRSHGVMVSTPDSESGNPSSNLGGTFKPFNVERLDQRQLNKMII